MENREDMRRKGEKEKRERKKQRERLYEAKRNYNMYGRRDAREENGSRKK